MGVKLKSPSESNHEGFQDSSAEKFDKKRKQILKVSHALAFSIIVPCLFFIFLPVLVHDNKLVDVLSDLGLAFLAAALVYKLIELWVDKEYRELRIQEYRETLIHRDVITGILKDEAVEDILEACLRVLFADKNVACGVRGLLKHYSSKLPMSESSHREVITVSVFDERYYKISRVVSYCRSYLPSVITFRCILTLSSEEHRKVILDRKTDSWLFLNHSGDDVLPDEAFIVSNLKVDSVSAELLTSKTEKSPTEIEFLFRVPDSIVGKETPSKIKFEMEVLQSREFGFVGYVNSVPVKDVSITFKSELGVPFCVISEGMSCIGDPDIIQDDHSAHISVESWLFPSSNVVFSWSESALDGSRRG